MEPTIFELIDNIPVLWNQMSSAEQITTGSVLGLFAVGTAFTTYKIINRAIYRPVKSVVTAPFRFASYLKNRGPNKRKRLQEDRLASVFCLTNSNFTPNQIDDAVKAIIETNGQILEDFNQKGLQRLAESVRNIQISSSTKRLKENLVLWDMDNTHLIVGQLDIDHYKAATRYIAFYLNQYDETRRIFSNEKS